MKATSSFQLTALFGLAFFGTALIAQENQAPTIATTNHSTAVQTQEASHPAATEEAGHDTTRIIRVQVDGTAQLDRNTGLGFEPLISNMPIIQGNKLRTENGLADVQFEDASTLRITPNSVVVFPQLARSETGAMTSRITLLKGTAYLNLRDTIAYGNTVEITFGNQLLLVAPGSHIHVSVDSPKTQVVVFQGEVRANGPSGVISIGPKQTLLFPQDKKEELASLSTPVLKKGIRKDDYDEWDKDSIRFQQKYARNTVSGLSPYSYGIADLYYYGQFINDPSCGQMWQPYFVSSSWDPYANGMWAWYPNIGYSWVSVYPWGWLPYHYGSWNYCGTRGWGWQPGGQWNAIQNAVPIKPALTRPQPGLPIRPRPVAPPHPPQLGRPTLIVASSKPLVASHFDQDGNLVLRRDSAGLGVPRGFISERSMMKLSNGAIKNGSASTPVMERFGQPTNNWQLNNGVNNGFSANNGGSSISRPSVSASASGARPVAVGSPGGISRPVSVGGGPGMSAPAPAPAPSAPSPSHR